MAGNGKMQITNTPADITGDDFSALAFSVQNGEVCVNVTPDTSAPDPANGGALFRHGEGKPASQGLDDIWPGVTAPQRVWAWTVIEGDVADLFRSWAD